MTQVGHVASLCLSFPPHPFFPPLNKICNARIISLMLYADSVLLWDPHEHENVLSTDKGNLKQNIFFKKLFSYVTSSYSYLTRPLVIPWIGRCLGEREETGDMSDLCLNNTTQLKKVKLFNFLKWTFSNCLSLLMRSRALSCREAWKLVCSTRVFMINAGQLWQPIKNTSQLCNCKITNQLKEEKLS